jgi:hypothetical protein
MLARWFKDTNGSITASGSSNAYAITSNRTLGALVNNQVMAWTSNHANTGAATLNLNGLGAAAIKRPNGNALLANDIVSGQAVVTIYKSSTGFWYLLSMAGALLPTPARAYATYAANAALSTIIPLDDTIPQSNEGTEIVTASITPQATTNRIRVTFTGQAHGSGTVDAQRAIAALFQDSVADALCATATHVNSNEGSSVDEPAILSLTFEHSPATVSAVTYKIRVGANSGTVRMNGTASARWFGGVSIASLVLQEVFV